MDLQGLPKDFATLPLCGKGEGDALANDHYETAPIQIRRQIKVGTMML